MNVPAMFNLARELTHTNSSDYPDTRLLPFLNAVKDDFWSYIITGVSSKYNWDRWTITATVVNQSEYVIPAAATDSEGNLKINTVSVCYKGDSYKDGSLKYIEAEEKDINNLPRHWNWYVNNQPAESPIYYTADKSVFIAPTFDKVVNDGIELQGIKNIVDYTATTTESNTKIPSYLHNDLVQGLLPYIHRSEGLKKDAKMEEDIYKEKKEEAAQKIANRSTGPGQINYVGGFNHTYDPYDLIFD